MTKHFSALNLQSFLVSKRTSRGKIAHYATKAQERHTSKYISTDNTIIIVLDVRKFSHSRFSTKAE